MYTRLDFSRDILTGLGVQTTDRRLYWLTAWSIYESQAPNSAKFNLLNTTLKTDHSTNYNTVGVQNYTSLNEGVQATIRTLKNGYYNSIYNLLVNGGNDGNYTGSDIMNELVVWGTGNGKNIFDLSTLLMQGKDNRANDVFQGENITNASTLKQENLNIDINTVHGILTLLDYNMIFKNPFDITYKSNSGFSDPLSWMQGLGSNLFHDSKSLIIRGLIISLGVIIIWKSAGIVVKVGNKNELV